MNLRLLYVPIQKIKKKLIFLGDINSINIELIIKSFSYLKSKVDYVLFCNKKDLENNFLFKKSKIKLNEIYDPYKFLNYDKNKLNIYNIEDISKKKYINLLNQIKICNDIANITKYDLVTMPVNKSIFKKIHFIGMTEYLGKINNTATIMLMVGEVFSIIPYTTHINIKNVNRSIKFDKVNLFIKNILISLKKEIYQLNFKKIFFMLQPTLWRKWNHR